MAKCDLQLTILQKTTFISENYNFSFKIGLQITNFKIGFTIENLQFTTDTFAKNNFNLVINLYFNNIF